MPVVTPNVREDRELVDALRRREKAAWDELYRRHESSLYTYVYHRAGGDRALADDVFQETLLRAVERIEQFDPARGEPGAWLAGIALNERRQRQRTARSVHATAGNDDVVVDLLATHFLMHCSLRTQCRQGP